MVESRRVSKNCPGEYRKRVESVRVTKHGRIRASTGKSYNPSEYRKTVRVSTGKGLNLCEYRQMVESVRVSKNCPGEYWKGSNLCEYRKMLESGSVKEKVKSVRVSKTCPGEYRKMVESM